VCFRKYRSKFANEETVMFCLRVMVGVIILYDHVHPVGAFAKTSPIDVRTEEFALFWSSVICTAAQNRLKMKIPHTPCTLTILTECIQQDPEFEPRPMSVTGSVLSVFADKELCSSAETSCSRQSWLPSQCITVKLAAASWFSRLLTCYKASLHNVDFVLQCFDAVRWVTGMTSAL